MREFAKYGVCKPTYVEGKHAGCLLAGEYLQCSENCMVSILGEGAKCCKYHPHTTVTRQSHIARVVYDGSLQTNVFICVYITREILYNPTEVNRTSEIRIGLNLMCKGLPMLSAKV